MRKVFLSSLTEQKENDVLSHRVTTYMIGCKVMCILDVAMTTPLFHLA